MRLLRNSDCFMAENRQVGCGPVLKEKIVTDCCTWFLSLQLEDGHSLFDYDVGLNDTIQLLVRNNVPQLSDDHADSQVVFDE